MNIPENFDRWMFDYMEGNLSPDEVEVFERFLVQNPDFEPDADAWQNAVIPDENIVYPHQHALERKRRVAGWYGWSTAAALVLLIGVGGYMVTNTGSSDYTVESAFAQNDFTATNHNPEAIELFDMKGMELSHLKTVNSFSSEIEQAYTLNNENDTEEDISVNSGEATLSGLARGEQNVSFALSETNTIATDHSNEMDVEGEQEGLAKHRSLKQEQDKYDSDKYHSKYVLNPKENHTDLDLSKKNKVKYNSAAGMLKQAVRKIEKTLSYPVGLVNLRDPELILPENSLTSFNPGFVGSMLTSRYEINYRNQWLGTDQNATKVKVGFDNYIASIRGGVGVMINSSTFGNGEFGDHSIDLIYSPKVALSKNIVFEPAIKVSMGVLNNTPSKFEGIDAFELDRGLALQPKPAFNNKTAMQWYKDYGVGFVLNTKWFYTGFSADNLGGHYANVFAIDGANPTRTPILLTGVIGADYESRNKNTTLSPFISYRQFGELMEIWGGANARLGNFTIGGAYSNNQDFTLSAGMKFKKFKLIYHYDETTTVTNDQQIGSHNLSIRFNGELKNGRFKY